MNMADGKKKKMIIKLSGHEKMDRYRDVMLGGIGVGLASTAFIVMSALDGDIELMKIGVGISIIDLLIIIFFQHKIDKIRDKKESMIVEHEKLQIKGVKKSDIKDIQGKEVTKEISYSEQLKL
jgi:hypothetical protein